MREGLRRRDAGDTRVPAGARDDPERRVLSVPEQVAADTDEMNTGLLKTYFTSFRCRFGTNVYVCRVKQKQPLTR